MPIEKLRLENHVGDPITYSRDSLVRNINEVIEAVNRLDEGVGRLFDRPLGDPPYYSDDKIAASTVTFQVPESVQQEKGYHIDQDDQRVWITVRGANGVRQGFGPIFREDLSKILELLTAAQREYFQKAERDETLIRWGFESSIPQSQWTKAEGAIVAARQNTASPSNSGSQTAID
jgi:hypothetical protein